MKESYDPRTKVRKVYEETINALGAESLLLEGIGAMVESVCNDRSCKGRDR
jgi:hypothetical protein